MLENFNRDLEIGKRAEQIVFEVSSALDSDRKYEMVGGVSEFFYMGDIVALDKDGKPTYIEVKNDSRIADTGNVLCEEEVYYKRHDYYGKGNMECDCDIYAVVSEEQRKIYVIDFKVLKSNYRKGIYKEIEHPQQITYCYLLDLNILKRLGGLISVVSY
jgi:hypothetical protein